LLGAIKHLSTTFIETGAGEVDANIK